LDGKWTEELSVRKGFVGKNNFITNPRVPIIRLVRIDQEGIFAWQRLLHEFASKRYCLLRGRK